MRVVAVDGRAVCLTMMKDYVGSIVTGAAFGFHLPGIELSLGFRLHEPLSNERSPAQLATSTSNGDEPASFQGRSGRLGTKFTIDTAGIRRDTLPGGVKIPVLTSVHLSLDAPSSLDARKWSRGSNQPQG